MFGRINRILIACIPLLFILYVVGIATALTGVVLRASEGPATSSVTPSTGLTADWAVYIIGGMAVAIVAMATMLVAVMKARVEDAKAVVADAKAAAAIYATREKENAESLMKLLREQNEAHNSTTLQLASIKASQESVNAVLLRIEGAVNRRSGGG